MSEIKKAELRPAFVYLSQRGKSSREIAKFFGVDKDTVNRAINRFNETGSNKNKPGSGRPRTATDASHQQAVANEIASNPSTKFNSARKLARRLSLKRSSVQRILKRDLKLFPYKMKKRQLLKPEHIKKRLQMCKAFRVRFSNNRHRQVVWTDEKIFTIEQAHNQQNDRIYAVEPPEDDARAVSHQQHPKQVMVFAGICHNGKLPLVFIDPEYSYDQVYYRQAVLREVVKPWAEEQFGEDEEWTFQQDGATCHTAKKTQEWFERNGIDFIKKNEWPPCSPDLNPMDYSVWSILEQRACREAHQTLESLKAALQREWDNLDLLMINRIVDNFPKRVKACIRAKGKHFE